MEQYRKDFWKRMAFICRYGHTGLVDAMAMPTSDSVAFMDAINTLIGEESPTASHND